MAGVSNARRFSDADKATGLTLLAANQGNIKRTARELDISPVTLRRWRDQDLRGVGGPTEQQKEVAVGDFVEAATRIRNKALVQLEQALDRGDVRPADLNKIMGTLDDKIRLAQGMPTSRVEQQSSLPSKAEMAELMGAAVAGAIEAARSRQNVIQAEVVRELPAPAKR